MSYRMLVGCAILAGSAAVLAWVFAGVFLYLAATSQI